MEVLELDHSNELVARVLTHFLETNGLAKTERTYLPKSVSFPNQFYFQ